MSEPTYSSVFASPIGDLLLTSNGEALTGVHMEPHKNDVALTNGWRKDDALLAKARGQLRSYFGGEQIEFDLPLSAEGTEFQKRVWAELRRIPYGTTISYGELARRIGQPAAVRAVGRANGQNPIAIIIPCHRVIGADGSLTGFGGGIDRKRALLDLEAQILNRAADVRNAEARPI
jgi:methylated-DNA-[protein]-cysteine S-methyltransferase